MRRRILHAVSALAAILVLTVLWVKTQSLDPNVHTGIDSALRELRSLDRTINQDVLRARYQLVDSYHPVLKSYRRIEQLEARIASPPLYLGPRASQEWTTALEEYRSAVTAKQASIEKFKYRSAELMELLGYLPGAGTGVSRAAAEAGHDRLAQKVDEVLRLALLYNLTSDEKYAPAIRAQLEALARESDRALPPSVRRRIKALTINIRRLLEVKPEVDRLLVHVFEQPVEVHEERMAALYYGNYAVAARAVNRYRVLLYTLCIGLVGLVAYGVRRLQRSAGALALANEQLEERVANRTRELAQRNREMRIVLDNVGQALFTVDLEGRLSRERSAALDRWFPGAASMELLWEVIGIADSDSARWMRLGWEQLRERFLPYDIVLDQLPHALHFGGRHYEIAYLPILDGHAIEKILLVVSDVTERIERTRSEREQQEQAVVFQHVMRDRSGFLEFLSESQRLIGMALESQDVATTLRAIHTLKGNVGMYGVEGVAGICHDLESKLAETHQPLEPADARLLSDAWAAFANMANRLTGTEREGIEIAPDELQSLQRVVSFGAPASELLRRIRYLEREPASRRLARLAEHAKYLAGRFGKGDLNVRTEAHGVRLDARRWAPFWSSFVHVLRNAVEHGIETEAERVTAGKPAGGQLVLRVQEADGQVIIEMIDDGRGIDWVALRRKAKKLGLVAESEQELLDQLLHGGLSTKTTVTEYSGRGVGLSACVQACLDLGGTLVVATRPREGTTFRLAAPSDDMLERAVPPVQNPPRRAVADSP